MNKALSVLCVIVLTSWLSFGCLSLGAQTPSQNVTEPDDVKNKLTDYAKAHKYLIDPQRVTAAEKSGINGGDPRKESTYTITSVMRIAKPFNIADMTDDYQDARLISEDEDSATIEFVYYPLNTNKEAIGEDPDWKGDYAGMTQYLRPTITENWDEQMRADLMAELRKDGIDPDKLTDKQLVTRVSRWLMRRNHFTKTFAVWDVYYPAGKPEVFPLLRAKFDLEKSSPNMSDQALFDSEVLGRSMFYNRTRGSCTSSAVLMATVMRALGIPTRIAFFVPAADGNDPRQRKTLLENIHDHAIRATVLHGLRATEHSFSNHLFNEVFVGRRWVRLNYDVLGQNIVDAKYFGLMTHILNTDSLSHVPMAETWGSRLAKYPEFSPKLSSINPYQLLSVSDHFGAYSHIDNPAVDDELKKVTVIEAYWKDALPPSLPQWITQGAAKDSSGSDFYIGIKEFIPDFQSQQREFVSHAGNHFILVSPGHAEIKAALSELKMSNGDGPRTYNLFGVRIDTDSRGLLVPGVKYTIHPVNTSEVYAWTVKDGVLLQAGTLHSAEKPSKTN
jgi:hypothetical protein